MKKYLILLLTTLLIACSNVKTEQGSFVNTDCNIPIIECVLGVDTVDVIVDTGAEYSLIDSKYLENNECFTVVNSIETQFSGIGGVNTQISRIVSTKSSLGYITFVEQNLDAVVESLPNYNIVGLIGSDFLKSRNYIIDYKSRKIYPYEQLDSIYGKSYN